MDKQGNPTTTDEVLYFSFPLLAGKSSVERSGKNKPDSSTIRTTRTARFINARMSHSRPKWKLR